MTATGIPSLDLGDIAFTSGVTKASYSGGVASGTLTVTDGTHTAHLTLTGDYTGVTFLASSDGHGGADVSLIVASPGPDHWVHPVSGDFSDASKWSSGVVPGSGYDAILDPAGAAFTVTVSSSPTVKSIQTSANATLDISSGAVTAMAGTGDGANAGTLLVHDAATLAVAGMLDNTGLIHILGASHATGMEISADTTLGGGGNVILGGTSGDEITGGATAATLTNIDNVVTGFGQVGGGQLTLVNEAAGVIDAARKALILDTGALTILNAGLIEGDVAIRSPIANTGALQAAAGETLTLAGAVLQSGAGAILAGAGGRVWLQNADIVGGSLGSAGSGAVVAIGSNNNLEGTSAGVTVAGELDLIDGAGLTLSGEIANKGDISIGGEGKPTELVIGAAGATLSGGGLVILRRLTTDLVIGSSASATLTNVNDVLVSDAGNLGGGQMVLVNEAGGVVRTDSGTSFTIDTGAHTILNAGLVAALGGTITVASPINNTGSLNVGAGGTLALEAAVSGAGVAVIYSGALDAAAAFSEGVTFGASGELVLAQSQAYGGTIAGFSHSGSTSLDLKDIAYISGTTKATFSGGVLTVTDGTHTANIHLKGNFSGSTFTVADDGSRGTVVTDPRAAARMTAFAASMDATAAVPPAGAHLAPAPGVNDRPFALLAPNAQGVAA